MSGQPAFEEAPCGLRADVGDVVTRRALRRLARPINWNLMKQVMRRSHLRAASEIRGEPPSFNPRITWSTSWMTFFSSLGSPCHHCGTALPVACQPVFSFCISLSHSFLGFTLPFVISRFQLSGFQLFLFEDKGGGGKNAFPPPKLRIKTYSPPGHPSLASSATMMSWFGPFPALITDGWPLTSALCPHFA